MNEPISWDQSLVKKFSSSNHYKLLTQLRNEVKKYPLNNKNKTSNTHSMDLNLDNKNKSAVLLNNNSQFNKIGEIKNVYNRIIIYDASTYHAQTSSWSKTGMRLTQPIFMNCLTPVEQRPLWLRGIGYPASLV